MKHWPSQTFPVILLALLAGLSFWLQKTVDRNDAPNDGKFRHDPDAIAENFVVRRFDDQGRVKYRLSSPYLVHYGDDDSSLITEPTLLHYRPDAPPITLAGKQAKISAKGETVYLWGGVIARRPATADRPEMTASMPDLTVQPEAGTAFTNSQVEINQGSSWLKGTGLNLDNNNSTLVLQSQITGLYFRPRGPQ